MNLSFASDSEDEGKSPAAAPVPPTQPEGPDLECSTTKYLPPEGSTDEDDTEEGTGNKTLQSDPVLGRGGGGGGGDQLNYVEVRCDEVKKKPAASKPRRPLFGKRKSKKGEIIVLYKTSLSPGLY